MATTVYADGPEEIPLLPSMNREQTIAFLNKHRVFSLGLNFETYEEKFVPHKAFLYVFPDSLTIGVFEIEDPTRRPSIARIDNPTELRFGGVLRTEGQIDYYAIDPHTEEIFRVRGGGSRKEYKLDIVGMPYLFPTLDTLFPKALIRP